MPFKSVYLFPRRDTRTDPLALRPLDIRGMIEPVVGGDGGINIEMMEENANGVQCLIRAWGEPMLAGDKYEVYWDGDSVFKGELPPDEVNKDVFFYIPTDYIKPGWAECHYELTRLGETTPEPSTALRVLVKLNQPGGRDNAPHLPDGHSELNIVKLPDDLIEQGVIDAEWAEKGVPMTVPFYPEITAHDTMLVRWGTTTLTPHPVTEDQADEKDAIVITADQDAILAGGDSNRLEIKYDIHDEVWNWAVRHSKRTYIGVEAGAWFLDAPIIQQSINGVITIRDLNKEDVEVNVSIGADFQQQDTVTMTWIGTPFTGKPLIHTETRTVVNIPSIMTFLVPYEDVRQLAKGSADASYVLRKNNGDPPLSSKRETADVVGDPFMLPEPVIRELLGDTLEPDEPNATVDIRYSMTEGELVNMIWDGIRSDDRPYVHEEEHIISRNEAEAGIITLYVSNEHISVLDGGRLDLSYRVSNDLDALYGVSESERLLVKIENVTASLPAPKVVEADPPDILDPSKVFDNVTVLVDYLGTIKGDILTYYWQGVKPFGSTCDWMPITSLIEGEPIRFRVDKQFVTANIGQYVKVRYSLKRAATGLFNHSATLNLLIGSLVGDLDAPEVVQAPDHFLDPGQALNGVDVRVGYENMDPALDTITLHWVGTPGAGTSKDLELPGDSSGSVLFHLPPTVIGPNINKAVDVCYFVKRYGHDTDSPSLGLRVLSFQDPENELPRPQIPQATDDVLDLMTFTGDADVLVERWPYIALKQRAWLWLEGKTTAGTEYIITLLDNVEVTAAQVSSGLKENLSRNELMKLGHSSPASVKCAVAFYEQDSKGEAIAFPSRSLTVRTRYDYVTPVITDVTDSRGEVPEGGKTRDAEVTLKGTATRGETIELFDGASTSKGTSLVGADSVWTRKIDTSVEKDYSITAKALYGADPASSEPRTFTVKFAQTPEILTVTDSRGPVAPQAITYDNSVLVTGSATPNLQIQLFDGSSSIATRDVDDVGDWNYRVTGLTVKTYSLTAKALYEIEPDVSPPRIFIVAQAVTPTISRVEDVRGDVALNGTTYYKSVTLSGKASPNEKITLRDGATLIDTVIIDSTGGWKYVYGNLTLKTYSLTAKAEYGSEPVSEPARVFTVAAHIVPSITSVTDTVGIVQPGATTYDTSVTVRGRATPREKVEVFDSAASKGSVTVGGTGDWQAPLSNLTAKSYSITAKALYPVTPDSSEPRTFIVGVNTPPAITYLRDSIRDIPQNGTTIDTSVRIDGRVTPSRQVQIYDNGSPKHTVTSNGSGDWNTTLAVGIGGHSVYAKAIGTGNNSNTRSFTVNSPIPPLTINTSTMNLSAWHFRDLNTPTNPPAGAYGDRTPQGGVPPYRYESSNIAFAEVNNNTGRVISRGNGSATITVRDNSNQSVSYPVTTSNVDLLFGTGHFSVYGLCASTASSMGGRIPSLAEWRAYINNYRGGPSIERWCWASDSGGGFKRMVIFPATGQTDTRLDFGNSGGTADGFGIRRA
ncbi:hypothetical protein GIW70_00625 [Pseudomonas syringae]|nr:hypothetical protein [Pseudomonas syringae]MCF5066700.1 hypothetical protein [Pseudomonas syringae]